ncbi:MAG: bifunctional lysylphosphatidylglycerol flippase/synthetase MprF [Vicinamibacterales bacterium]
MLSTARRYGPVAAGLLVFAIALRVLRTELHGVSWHQLSADIARVHPSRLALALLLTTINYAVLTGYDFLAFTYIGKRLPRAQVAFASFLSYAVSNNIGFAMLSGASVRYRFYTRWGLTGEELSRIVFSYSVTFWLGLLAVGGVSLALGPAAALGPISARAAAPIGVLLTALSIAYVAAAASGRASFRLGSYRFPLPTLRIAVTQLVLSAVDWVLAGAVLFVLLPSGSVPFLTFLGAFLVAILAGMASHVPGGLGVFDGLLVLLLKPSLRSADVLPALVVFRGVYYLLPFAVAVVGLAVDEFRQRRAQTARVTAAIGRLTEQVTPRLFGLLTFLSGSILLFSGATPAAPGRLERLEGWLPLGVIEVSHFAGSLVGVVLLLVSQGLARRLDAAYYLATGAIGVGIATTILKGLDYEEAVFLTCVLVFLLRFHAAFHRRAAFFETRFSAVWVATVLGTLGASVWLGFFAFKHVNYSGELWWEFALRGEASRFLRASVGAAGVILLFGVARLVRPAPHDVLEPSPDDLRHAAEIIARQPRTSAQLVFLRDKGVIFNEDRTGFVMYGVQGRTWVALGDPIGPDEAVTGLIRQFLERCNDFDGVPVFYEVSTAHLHRYADFGLTFAKVGEEARVDLTAFRLDGPRGARYRQSIRRLEKDGGQFEIVAAADVAPLIPALRAVSDDWLKTRAGTEKGFSLGFFDDEYMARFPMAIVRFQGRIVAFANVWLGADGGELSVDLMRFDTHAPKGVMEALFANLLRWAKAQGYRWFVLGMAPLSGIEQSPAASLWNRLGAFLYRHGESMYHFQGLRAYKEKFDPVWEPHYLAYPGGMKLPRILADVSALVAGGYRRIFM